MVKRLIILVVLAAIVLGLIFGFEAFRTVMIGKFMATLANPPQTVSTTVSATSSWQDQIKAVGALRAVRGADLSMQVTGIVDAISFKSGDDVAAGTVLLHLQLNDDPAKLAQLQASADLSATILERDQKQFHAQAVSQATVDSDAANLRVARAQVMQQQAVMAEKTLLAPFAGHLGIRQIDLGQYLAAGTTVVSLQALDPILMDFYVPQQALAQLKVGEKAIVHVDTYAGRNFDATIIALNSKIDNASRTAQVRASLPNPDHALLPGMYATIDINVGVPQTLLTLPQTAITFNPYGNTVYVVEADGKDDKGQTKLHVQQTFITTGLTRGDQISVLKGITAGQTVVTSGQLKLHNGTNVTINNNVKQPDSPNPHPAEE